MLTSAAVAAKVGVMKQGSYPFTVLQRLGFCVVSDHTSPPAYPFHSIQLPPWRQSLLAEKGYALYSLTFYLIIYGRRQKGFSFSGLMTALPFAANYLANSVPETSFRLFTLCLSGRRDALGAVSFN